MNHFPIVGSIIGALVLLVGFALKDSSIKRISMVIMIGASVLAVPVYLTGEGAEETVEHAVGVNESTIEAHEDLAKTYILLVIVLGVASLATLVLDMRKMPVANILYYAVFLFTIGTVVVAKSLGTYGGMIRHPEIGATAPAGGGEAEDDD